MKTPEPQPLIRASSTRLLDSDKPPICLHILGQGLVTALWQEGRDVLKDLEVADKICVRTMADYSALWHKCKKLEEQVADLNDKIKLLNDLNNL